ncbi:MAG TPA: glyoxylate reductase [Spirochaetia bacterium]|nr:glyoxylate reductase [Spirochaetia bacterium]
MKQKILFMCKIDDKNARQKIERYYEVAEKDPADEKTILENIRGMAGLVVPFTNNMLVTRRVIDAGTDLKIIGSSYGGTRQNIEDIYALEKGLTVIHTGASRPRPMAEYTLSLILSSLLQIHNYHHYMRSGEAWPRFKYGRTKILHKRTIGIIGLGQIGREICSLLKNFSSDISVRSSHLSTDDARELGVRKAELDEIFRTCEIIILSGGYTDQTHHMIGKKQFELMPENALFVNIARGKMVNQEEMINVLAKKNIYLALDVFENEPLEENSPLRNNDRVLLTPHRANNSIEFEERWQCLADEFELYFQGKNPLSALTIERARVMSES